MSVAFLPGILPANARIIIEIAFGANLNADASNWAGLNQWIDVTADAWQAGIGQPLKITLGRSDEFGQAPPAQCSLVLDNSTGKYSKGPQSSNYPFVRRNTPIRVQVTLNGITKFTRFFGYITTFDPHDDTSAKVAWVNVQAYGSLRRLQQGKTPIRSPLTRAVLSDAAARGLYQYWPCEDDVSSTQAGSGISGGVPLLFTGGPVVGGLDPNTVNGVFGSTWLGAGFPPQGMKPMPRLNNGAQMSATFPPGNASAWTVQFAAWTDINESTDTPTLDRTYAQWETPGGTYVKWQVIADYNDPTFGGVTKVVATKADGTTSSISFNGLLSSFLVEYVVSCQQSGGDIAISFGMRGNTSVTSGTFTTATLAGITSFKANPLAQVTTDLFAISQARIWNQAGVPAYQLTPGTPTFGTAAAWFSYWSEDAVTRLSRLFTQEGGLGLPLVVTGTSNIPMGAQSTGKFADVIRECETADGGILYDGLSQGMNYVSRAAKYNQTATLVLDASAAQLDPPFEPKDDDQANRNLWVVNRQGGTSATATDKTGPVGTDAIDTYDDSKTVNTATDTPLVNIAGWLLRLGTVDEPYRYPKLGLDLSAIPSKAFDWLSTAIGNRIDITNLSSVSASRYPPGTVGLILEGYTETIWPYGWTVQGNCSPASPWEVDSLNNKFRLELSNIVVGTAISPGATSVRVDRTNPASPPFTTTAAYPADFPLDLLIGGWPIHVTAATWAGGAFDPFFLTTSATPNTSTIPVNTPAQLLRPAALAL